MWAIFKRETTGFFQTPLGYIYMGMFLFLSGLFFTFLLNPGQGGTYTDVLGTMSFTLIFTTPILTMKLLSEERKTGTDQLLLTSPVSTLGVIVGKYLAAVCVFLCTIVITFIYPMILSKFAVIDVNVIIVGYLGYFLLGAAFIAIGVFVSSLTENQTVAAITSFGILLVLWIMEFLKNIINLSEKGQKTFDWFLVLNRFGDFESGVLNFSAVIYFISIVAIFLFFTLRIIEKRRWSKG